MGGAGACAPPPPPQYFKRAPPYPRLYQKWRLMDKNNDCPPPPPPPNIFHLLTPLFMSYDCPHMLTPHYFFVIHVGHNNIIMEGGSWIH